MKRKSRVWPCLAQLVLFMNEAEVSVQNTWNENPTLQFVLNLLFYFPLCNLFSSNHQLLSPLFVYLWLDKYPMKKSNIMSANSTSMPVDLFHCIEIIIGLDNWISSDLSLFLVICFVHLYLSKNICVKISLKN